MWLHKILKIQAAITMVLVSNLAIANPIAGNTSGEPDRTATLVDADQCAYGIGNPDATDIASYYGEDWASAGELTGNGTNTYLSATSDDGWGNIPNSGTWEIDDSFWDVYDQAVITMHIGDGNGDPDHWAWLVLDGTTSGTWEVDFTYVDGTSTKGGGLSNIRLWGANTGTTVAEPGTGALVSEM